MTKHEQGHQHLHFIGLLKFISDFHIMQLIFSTTAGNTKDIAKAVINQRLRSENTQCNMISWPNNQMNIANNWSENRYQILRRALLYVFCVCCTTTKKCLLRKICTKFLQQILASIIAGTQGHQQILRRALFYVISATHK